MQGRCVLRRLADDGVMGGEREAEARRMLVGVPTRCARFQLPRHPPKTRLRRCPPPRHEDAGERGDGPCACLGRPPAGANSRRGSGVLKRRTAKKRWGRARRAVGQGCRVHRHDPRRAPARALCQQLRGHAQAAGMREPSRPLEALERRVERAWRAWLSRRGGPRTIRGETWAKRCAVLPVPTPRSMHTR
jgi:hypothetical protein